MTENNEKGGRLTLLDHVFSRVAAHGPRKAREDEMRTSGKPESELAKAASRKLPKPDWYDGNITEVMEDTSKRGNEMFKATVVFEAAETEWTLFDYLTDTAKGGLRLRRCCSARGVAEKFEAGFVEASDLPGPVRIKVGIQKQRGGFPDRLVILDYAAPAAAVVNLADRFSAAG